ncbi:MAG: hypothetical protein WBV39_05185, partial [Rudaea sp.]
MLALLFATGVTQAVPNTHGASPQFAIDYDSSVAGSLCYVDASATAGGNTGASWSDAYIDLQSALGDTNCTEVWVAAGVYKPGTQATDSFVVAAGVAVYGGFAGSETTRSQRVPGIDTTVLSGDIDSNDNLDANGVDVDYSDIQGTNSYTVVTMDGRTQAIGADTVLDGFTITGGDAQGSFPLHSGGGGLLCLAYLSGVCSPSLSNLEFSGNNSGDVGGAIYALGNGGSTSPSFDAVTFRGNHAQTDGGAMYLDGGGGGTSNATLSNVTFNGNQADGNGGALYNQ